MFQLVHPAVLKESMNSHHVMEGRIDNAEVSKEK